MSNQNQVFVSGTCEGIGAVMETLQSEAGLELVGSSDVLSDANAWFAAAGVAVVVHASTTPSAPAEDLATLREYTSAPVILLTNGDSSQILDDALDAGFADVVGLPGENVVSAIRKVCHAERRRKGLTRGRVTTVFCPKGGVGKSTISVNLAAALAKHNGQRTLLLDLDLQFGDTAIMLGVEPQVTMYDLMIAPGKLDAEKLAGYTTRHSSGLELLPAPKRPEEADLVTELKIIELIAVARTCYDVIIVDTPPFFHGPMLAAIDRTDDLLVPCGLDVPTIKNVSIGLETLRLLSVPRDRIRLILNQANVKAAVSRSEVEHALKSKVNLELPHDSQVLAHVNLANPIVLADRKAAFSLAIRRLADEIAGSGAGSTKPRGRLLARPRAKS